MKIILEQSTVRMVLSTTEIDLLLHGKILQGYCQLSEEDNILSWSVKANYETGTPDISFDHAHLNADLPRMELSNLLDHGTGCICHVLHPSKHELHLCIEKSDEIIYTNEHNELTHPAALRKT